MLEQERLQTVYEERMQLLLDRMIGQARWHEARRWAEHWISNHAISEHPYRALIKVHAGLGDQAGMAAAFQRCTHVMTKELGIDPSRETKRLFTDLMSGKRVLPPLPSVTESEKSVVKAKLPLNPTPFVGRTDEIGAISQLLADPERRLVSITGPGGMGKTRLAIEAARGQSCAFPDGVFFISLAPLDDPVFVVSLIAETVGFSFHVRDQREQWEADLQIAQLTDYLRDKRLLLVLDNMEHLLTASVSSAEEEKRGAEAVAADILAAAPGVKILTTSRERLNLQGETPVFLEGLKLPGHLGTQELNDVKTFSAVRLFVRTAVQVCPEFVLAEDNLAAVLDICRWVDGMPLAIQLAAAWVELLSPDDIVSELQKGLALLETSLQDVPVRQRSMQAIFESTWQRLSQQEKDAFCQIALFRGGFSRQAAEAVAGASLPVLRALVNKSLVRPDRCGRCQLHELLRQFALEQLAKFPDMESAATDRHCDYFAGFLHHREKDITGSCQGRALAEIEVEIDNIRAAWKRAVSRFRFDRMEQIMESLCEFYRIRGELTEGFETFYPAAIALGWKGFPKPGEVPDSESVFEQTLQFLKWAYTAEADGRKEQVVGRVLARYARFHCESPSSEWQAYYIRHSALKTLAETGAVREIAWVLRYMAHSGFSPGQTEILYNKARRIFEETGDHRGAAGILFRLGMTASQLGDFQKADRFYRESLAKSRDIGARQTVMFCLAELGWDRWALGDYAEAEKRYNQSLALSTEIGYPSYRATILRYLSRIALSRGDCDTAGRLLEKSSDIYATLGLKGMLAETVGEKACVAFLEGDDDRACRLAEESVRLCRLRTHRAGVIAPLRVLGEVCVRRGDVASAGTHFCSAMQTALELWMPPNALDAMADSVSLLAAMEQKERAADLAGFVFRHSAAWQWSRERVTPFVNPPVSGLTVKYPAVKDPALESVVRELSAFLLG